MSSVRLTEHDTEMTERIGPGCTIERREAGTWRAVFAKPGHTSRKRTRATTYSPVDSRGAFTGHVPGSSNTRTRI